jgi:transposase InsO family protein
LEEVNPGWRKHFFHRIGISKSSFYDHPTILQIRDKHATRQLLQAHIEHPFYGVARLAIHLGWSEMKTRRIRNFTGIVIPTASKKHRHKRGLPEIPPAPNILGRHANFKNEYRPQDGMSYVGMTKVGAWVQDFTYLKFQSAWYYLAVVLNVETRQIVGWRLGANHSSQLTYAAMLDALSKYSPPAILHSDQGSEYLSYKHRDLCQRFEIQLSCSAPGSPWQNGFMERWFGGFKLELGPLTKFIDLDRLHEGIAQQVYYYNTKRIHTALKMSPAAYATELKRNEEMPKLSRELVSGKSRG